MKTILFALIMFISLPALAEKTMCIPNNAGGEIHLLAGESKMAVSISQTGQMSKGVWSFLGKTKIHILWEGTTERIYSISSFNECIL